MPTTTFGWMFLIWFVAGFSFISGLGIIAALKDIHFTTKWSYLYAILLIILALVEGIDIILNGVHFWYRVVISALYHRG